MFIAFRDCVASMFVFVGQGEWTDVTGRFKTQEAAFILLMSCSDAINPKLAH